MIEAPLSVAAIAIYTAATGELALVAPAGTPLRPGQVSTTLPASYSAETHSWSTSAKAMLEDPTKVEAQLIAAVKAEAEQRKMRSMSSGGAKKTEYAEKRAEVIAWDSLGGVLSAALLAFDALPAAVRETRFTYAIADAAAFGDTIQAAIARFRAGMAAAGSPARIAAVEARACALIRAASTASTKRATAAAVIWTA